jgi:PTH1 family peptidyl-tRNA hydrolase
MMVDTRLIVGLGNPGREYRNNRHNIGFMFIDELARRLKTTFSRVQFNSLVTSVDYEDKKIILAKPQTFMNLSGKAVSSLINFYKMPLSDFIVANDDMDLPLGTIRIRPLGGSGGQKGLSSIIESLGTQDFQRFRLGIGHPPGQMEAADYVLQDFDKTETIIIEETLQRAVDAVLLFTQSGLNAAMTKFNG